MLTKFTQNFWNKYTDWLQKKSVKLEPTDHFSYLLLYFCYLFFSLQVILFLVLCLYGRQKMGHATYFRSLLFNSIAQTKIKTS